MKNGKSVIFLRSGKTICQLNRSSSVVSKYLIEKLALPAQWKKHKRYHYFQRYFAFKKEGIMGWFPPVSSFSSIPFLPPPADLVSSILY